MVCLFAGREVAQVVVLKQVPHNRPQRDSQPDHRAPLGEALLTVQLRKQRALLIVFFFWGGVTREEGRELTLQP